MRGHSYKYLFHFLTFLTCFFLVSASANAGSGTFYNRIVFFGDSLSDNGNLYSYDLGFLPKSPPYYDGRFSNGPVWSELIADYFFEKNFTNSVNYAFGGETSVLHDPLDGFLPYSLTMSLNDYLVRTMLTDRSKTLFIIWIGANDYLKGSDHVDTLTTTVVNNIKATIESLIYHGGMNFLIVNLPDLSKTPFGKSNMHENLYYLSINHNAKLEDAVTEIENSYKKVNIHMLNVNDVFETLLKNPEVYNKKYGLHIKDISHSCWGGGYTLKKDKLSDDTILQRLQERLKAEAKLSPNNAFKANKFDEKGFANLVASSPALKETFIVMEKKQEGFEPCQHPDEFVFWDRLHPTSIMHKMLSQIFIDYIEENYEQV